MIGPVLLAVVGVWLLTQTLVGGLPRVILDLGRESDGVTDGVSSAGPLGSGLGRLFNGAAFNTTPDHLAPAGTTGTTTAGAGITDGMARIHAAVTSRGFAVTGDPGVVVCRPTNVGDGRYGSTWSQHAYGNAGDYFGSASAMQSLYTYLTTNPDGLPVGTVCYNRQGPCPHPHGDHVHVDAQPRQRGTPQGCR